MITERRVVCMYVIWNQRVFVHRQVTRREFAMEEGWSFDAAACRWLRMGPPCPPCWGPQLASHELAKRRMGALAMGFLLAEFHKWRAHPSAKCTDL
jgi:hypothetical protein